MLRRVIGVGIATALVSLVIYLVNILSRFSIPIDAEVLGYTGGFSAVVAAVAYWVLDSEQLSSKTVESCDTFPAHGVKQMSYPSFVEKQQLEQILNRKTR